MFTLWRARGTIIWSILDYLSSWRMGGHHANAEIIEFVSLGTKVSPVAPSLVTLSWLFLSRGMVNLHAQSKLGEGFPVILVDRPQLCIEGKLRVWPGRGRVEEVGLTHHPLLPLAKPDTGDLGRNLGNCPLSMSTPIKVTELGFSF